jgi:beta-phosphoglucomutase-like phosphatase (HAD superfamily)
MPYGLILDVEALLARATIAMFRELYDVEFAPEDFEPYVGAGSKRYTLGPAHMRGLEIDLETALSKRRENFLALLQSAESIAFPGAAELIEVAYDHPEWRLAVATSSRSDRAGATLAAAAVDLSRFDAVITGDMVTHMKPDPEIYLTSARIIGVPIRSCVVIEDSLVGLEAAKAAGARCIAVTNTFPRKKLAAADRIVDSLTQVDLAMLLALVA